MNSKNSFDYHGLTNCSMKSVPIGNGDLGANVWVMQGSICLLLSKTDAFSELHRLIKTGYIKLEFSNIVFDDDLDISLSLNNGILNISNSEINLKIWVDAFSPVYNIDILPKKPVDCCLKIINYRSLPLTLECDDRSNYQLNHKKDEDIGIDCTESADAIFSVSENTIGQYHHNGKSLYDFSLEHQGLFDYPNKSDALSDYTFGFLAKSDCMTVCDNGLKTKSPQNSINIKIKSISLKGKDVDLWKEQISNFPSCNLDNHRKYWNEKFKQTYIDIDNSSFDKFSEGFACQRYLNICSGRGKYPIKFNGSIFTCQASPHYENENFDYRNWGGYYWCQNTRLIYWSFLFSGDFEMMKPFFDLYINNLDFCKFRTKKYFGHNGAFYPETMSIFATYADVNYGWQRKDLATSEIENTYVRWHFNGTLEIAFMMLKYYTYSNDINYFNESCLPFIFETLTFFKEHFKVKNNKMLIAPTSSLETWQNCVNDTPTIAGIIAVCQLILELKLNDENLNLLCENLLKIVPEIPLKKKLFKTFIAPYEKNYEHKKNCENPELYTIFPFDLFKIGTPDIKIGINTYKSRKEKASNGWQQHSIQAAMLGLYKDAKKEVRKNYENTNSKCIFPSFYGPNYDWLPDSDNGNVANIALTQMLVQNDKDNIYVLPAWDKSISINFRLPIIGNFITVSYVAFNEPKIEFDKPENRKVVFNGNVKS
ncbi:MAG: DUF5703 domain-containing protein [Oscillospiraceae bacterium]